MKKRIIAGLLSVLLVSVLVYGCGEVVENGETTISGTIYAANGETPIPGVRVWTTGSTVEDTSDENGNFSLLVSSSPETKTVTAEIGSWIIDFEVPVQPGEDNKVSKDKTTFSNQNLKDPVDLAVVLGLYDRIENIITSLGYSYTTLEVTDLDNYTYISTFEAIFFNCGCSGASAAGETNLQNFVESAGKSLYISDYAGDYIENIWPNAINWYGGSVSAAKVGDGDQTVVADVVDPNLQTVLGKNTASIFYDLGAWVVISSEGTGTNVLLSGDPHISYSITLTGVPLAVKFQPGGTDKGTVIFTTFHNEAQEEIVTQDARKILQDFIFRL